MACKLRTAIGALTLAAVTGLTPAASAQEPPRPAPIQRRRRIRSVRCAWACCRSRRPSASRTSASTRTCSITKAPNARPATSPRRCPRRRDAHHHAAPGREGGDHPVARLLPDLRQRARGESGRQCRRRGAAEQPPVALRPERGSVLHAERSGFEIDNRPRRLSHSSTAGARIGDRKLELDVHGTYAGESYDPDALFLERPSRRDD